MKSVTLKTTRLILRPARLSDAAGYFDAGQNAELAAAAGFLRPKRLSQTQTFMRDGMRQWRLAHPQRLLFTAVDKKDGSYVGGFNVRFPHRGVGEIGYSVHPDLWGQGYATEAARKLVGWSFSALRCHRIQATTWVQNRKSMHVLKKIGLHREGRLRNFMKLGNWVRDEYMWGMTRQDWRSNA
jgi:ribosomal-protein-alanine N-acetyltransferase